MQMLIGIPRRGGAKSAHHHASLFLVDTSARFLYDHSSQVLNAMGLNLYCALSAKQALSSEQSVRRQSYRIVRRRQAPPGTSPPMTERCVVSAECGLESTERSTTPESLTRHPMTWYCLPSQQVSLCLTPLMGKGETIPFQVMATEYQCPPRADARVPIAVLYGPSSPVSQDRAQPRMHVKMCWGWRDANGDQFWLAELCLAESHIRLWLAL